MARVLGIGDPHEPFCLDGYMEHCLKVYRDWKCDRVVFLGDEVDQHAMSFHEHDPDGRSAGDEHEEAKAKLRRWYKAFPRAFVCIGNHTKLPLRQARAAGITRHWMKTYNEAWGIGSGWRWGISTEIDGVLYTHGTGNSGAMAHRNLAIKKRQSVVMGHVHSHAGIAFHASERDLLFGLNVGCGIDADVYAMEYGRDYNDKPIIACGVVVDGFYPHLVPMNLGAKYPRRHPATRKI